MRMLYKCSTVHGEGCTPPVQPWRLLRTRRRAECPSSMFGLCASVNVVEVLVDMRLARLCRACAGPMLKLTLPWVTPGSHQDLRSQVALDSP